MPLATRPTRDRFEAALYRLGLEELPLTLLYGHAGDALRAADVALVASGTATLEAALARCPHVIFYRVTPLTVADRPAQAACCPGWGCPTCSRAASSCRSCCRTTPRSENLAQAALNLYDDTVDAAPDRGAVRRASPRRWRRTPAALAAEAVAAELRAAGVAC